MTQTFPVTPPMPVWATDLQVQRAVMFGARAHEAQTRKYTGEPYIYHPIEVASQLVDHYGTVSPEILCAALLHDTVEDCEVTFTEIEREFGVEVRNLVFWLTDVCPKAWGNRATRKDLEVEKLRHGPVDAQVIKLSDMWSNTKSIVAHDPNFAVTYLQEKGAAMTAIEQMWASANSVSAMDWDFFYIVRQAYNVGMNQIMFRR
jgi:(p)ppGpp synthase/HD superfamily hydrolase